MTQEGKELLFKDLCARLPYGVILETDNVFPQKLEGISFDKDEFIIWVSDGGFKLDWMGCKPYLFPISSMTEEQKKELTEINPEFYSLTCWDGDIYISSMNVRSYDWLLKNHFDIYGLIPMGLANDATGKNIY